LSVSQYCSSQHLRREIELLKPDSMCWLSKGVGYPVAQELYLQWSGQKGNLTFGKVSSVQIAGKKVLLLATTWPGRGHEEVTRQHLRNLFRELKLPR
jgi:hypothetical protein